MPRRFVHERRRPTNPTLVRSENIPAVSPGMEGKIHRLLAAVPPPVHPLG